MSFHAGQAFLYPIDDKATPHLWVIATDPDTDGSFAIVNLTSLKGSKDQTVILRAGEHPFIRWDTCVAYQMARISQVQVLSDYLARGTARMHSPVSAEILSLIVSGFGASAFAIRRIREYVKASKR